MCWIFGNFVMSGPITLGMVTESIFLWQLSLDHKRNFCWSLINAHFLHTSRLQRGAVCIIVDIAMALSWSLGSFLLMPYQTTTRVAHKKTVVSAKYSMNRQNGNAAKCINQWMCDFVPFLAVHAVLLQFWWFILYFCKFGGSYCTGAV